MACEILVLVVEHQFDVDARVGFPEAGQHQRDHLDADDLAHGQPHHPALAADQALGVARGGAGGGGHVGEVLAEGQGQIGGLQPPRTAQEQWRADLALQLVDVAAEGGLGQAAQARRGRKAARLQHRVETLQKVPVGRIGHAQSNICSAPKGNSVGRAAGAPDGAKRSPP